MQSHHVTELLLVEVPHIESAPRFIPVCIQETLGSGGLYLRGKFLF